MKNFFSWLNYSKTTPNAEDNGAGPLFRMEEKTPRAQPPKDTDAASRAKSEFLANISHELRTPLNGVFSMLQLLQQSSLSGQQAEWTQTALHSANALLRILSDLIDLAQLEHARITLRLQPVDLKELVREVAEMFSFEVTRKKLRLTLHLGSSLPPQVMADRIRLRQVLLNIIGNSVKFTSSGWVHVECYAFPSNYAQVKHIVFEVQDSGIGMPEDFLRYFFEPFALNDGSNTRPYPGAGLGLSIVTKLVKMMNGTICVDSQPAMGTNFSFSIPCEIPPDMPAPEDSINQVIAWSPAGQTAQIPYSWPERIKIGPASDIDPLPEFTPGPDSGEDANARELARALNILLVEDDCVSQFALLSILKKEGHSAVAVNNGMEAVKALTRRPEGRPYYDCLITDIQMPVMDGLELVSHIRKQDLQSVGQWDNLKEVEACGENGENSGRAKAEVFPPDDFPVVALTAHALEGDEERFIAQGIDYYLTKPINLKQLRQVLKSVSARVYKNGL